ncbi:hypothetical protein ONS95_008341 [Cadophora gregata]|uniref:uncharacterized protein n=1 Tax=Cadophora gregata TaxID=51156 RepID=UPI0026DC9B41|nr:uncharacterized protein ONS95_008341 [Cadophora gregata]KAK0100387.1 hypothetical protein ONS96_007668 [Cadophora gregata f. sp. sojae]KAK0126760.1 hypothetical protein ONS95_008341 [Cadophora gregata]
MKGNCLNARIVVSAGFLYVSSAGTESQTNGLFPARFPPLRENISGLTEADLAPWSILIASREHLTSKDLTHTAVPNVNNGTDVKSSFKEAQASTPPCVARTHGEPITRPQTHTAQAET